MNKKELKKEVQKIDLEKIKKIFSGFTSIGKKTWFFTIIFFGIAFGFSLWTWWQCILNPSPSEDVILEIQKEQAEFEMKSKQIDLIIEKIRERKAHFEGAIDHQVDKKIFKSKEEIFQEMDPTSQSPNISGVNRMP